jgi:hypothetical protein
VYDDGQRLPATYANFLIVNGAVLMPTYGSPKDEAVPAPGSSRRSPAARSWASTACR